MGAVTLVFKKHNGPTPADDIAPQIRALQARWEPTRPDALSPFGPGSGSFFFFDRSGSDRTRAHLVSRLLLCPNTRTPHMYCMKYCYI